MPTVAEIVEFLEGFAPPRLAEDWDNVGLLVGDRRHAAARVMTCLTLTPGTVAEAVAQRADLVVSHHPFPFHPLRRVTADTADGRMLLELIAAGIAVYSPHTAFDSAERGINQRLAEGLGLGDIVPLVASDESAEPNDAATDGTGRRGKLSPPLRLGELADRAKRFLNISGLHVVGDLDRRMAHVAIACGSAGELLAAARDAGCDCLVLGETRFHTCLEAETADVALVLVGHYPSERFAVEALAGAIAEGCPDIHVWASRDERDPLAWV